MPGSIPVSRMPMSTPRPSSVGCCWRKFSTPVLPSAIQPWLYAASGGTIGWGGSCSSGSFPGGGVSAGLVDSRPGAMLGLGGGDWGSGCFGAQASVSITTRKLQRIQGIEFLAEGGRVELRKHEGTHMSTRVVGGDPESKGE